MNTRRNITIITLLILSGLLYTFFRADSTFFHYILNEYRIGTIPKIVIDKESPFLLKICAFNLPEFLWILALMISIKPIQFRNKSVSRYIGLIVIVIFSLLEVSQYYNLSKGTFDVMDIIAVLAAVLVSYVLEHIFFQKRHHSENNHHSNSYHIIRAFIVYLTIFLAHQIDIVSTSV